MVAIPYSNVLAVLLSDAGVERDTASDAQASPAAATEREMQARYRGEPLEDEDLGGIDEEPREPNKSFYHPYG